MKLQRRSSAQTFPLSLPASGFLAFLHPPPRLPDHVSGIPQLRLDYSSGTAPVFHRIPSRRKRLFRCIRIILQRRKKLKYAEVREARTNGTKAPKCKKYAKRRAPRGIAGRVVLFMTLRYFAKPIMNSTVSGS